MLKKIAWQIIGSSFINLKTIKNLVPVLLTLVLTNVTFSQTSNDDLFQWGNADSPWSVKEFKINSKRYYENTVAVIAPGENPNCKNGKIIVMTGQKREDRRMIISDLFNSQNKLNTIIGTNVTLDIDSKSEELATDNQIVKFNDGSLLAIKLGFLWSPITPKPFWWDWTSDSTTDYRKGARDAIFIYKSNDCGVTWANLGNIDPAKMGFGIPKLSDQDKDDNKVTDLGPNGETLYHSNGFDRQEVYYDKWTEKIYLTTQIASSGYENSFKVKVPGFDKYGVFMSSDKGKTWNLLKNGFTDKRNIVMTTNPDGRFFMFSASGGKPVLHYTKQERDFDLSSLDSINISCKKDYPNYPDKSQIDTEIHQFNENPTFSIANGMSKFDGETGLSRIYVSYPVLNPLGKGEFMIVKVDFVYSALLKQVIVNQKCTAVKASDANHSLGYGTFVESTEQQHLKKDNPYLIDPKTLFFYLESTAGDNFKGTEKAAFKGLLINNRTNDFSPKFFLSKDNNKDRWFPTFRIGEKKQGIGHYTKGAYFVHQKNQNYVAQWTELDEIHVSVISGVELWKKKD